jgi:hypothetical protein
MYEEGIYWGSSSVTHYDNYSLPDGNYNWSASTCANDTGGTVFCATATTNNTFTVDTIKPTLRIFYPPASISYSKQGTNLSLNYTISDINLASCWFMYNGTNRTTSCTANSSFILDSPRFLYLYANDTSGNFNFTNVSWVYDVYENGYNYNLSTYETSKESFGLNITYDNTRFSNIVAILVYNGSNYSSSKSVSGDNAYFNSSVIIPDITSVINKTFYWLVTIYNTSGSTTYPSLTFNQTINNITGSSCTSGTVYYNFTVYDEKNLTRLYNHDLLATLKYGIINKSNELNVNNIDVNETGICFSPANNNYYVDSIMEYAFSDDYVSRDYYLINDLATNATQHLELYLLPNDDSTTFIVKVQDVDLLPVAGVYVVVERYYPATDSYEVVQIVKTDENGKSVAFYEAENAYYRHTIKDADGVVLYQSDKQKVFPEQVPYTLTFTIGDSIDSPLTAYGSDDYSNYTFTFNQTSKIATLYYEDSAVDFSKVRLFIKKNSFATADITVCDTNSSISTATLTCNLSAYNSGTFSATYYATRGGVESIVDIIVFEMSDAIQTMGKEGLILAWFIIMTAGLIFMANMVAGIWAVNAAVIFTNVIGLAKFNPTWIFAMIAISIILTVVLKQGD